MFALSKVVHWLLDPVHFLLVVFLIGTLIRVLNRGMRSRTGQVFQVSVLIAVLALFFLPLGSRMLEPLENRFLPYRLQSEAGRLDGVIVLGGSLDLRASLDSAALIQVGSAGDRMLTAIEVLSQTDVDLYLTGGDSSLTNRLEVGESALVAEWLGQQGYDSSRIKVESQSRNTAEHPDALLALFPALKEGKYGLVTSAFHMPRAVGVFKKKGISVVPIPVDYRSDRRRGVVFGQGIDEWERFALAAREWGGLFFYYALGRTNEVFPSPDQAAVTGT
ncbi:MAG: YdcF family protein [Alphaproteobacteria bacterium]